MTEAPWRTKEYWGEGPWTNEPDYEYFEYKNHHCIVLRNKNMGNLNGYVFVKKDGPFDKEYMDIDLDCHGGITFGNNYVPFGYPVPEQVNFEEYTLIGFDCGHAEDIWPCYDAHKRYMRESEDPHIKKLVEGLKAIDDKYKEFINRWDEKKTYKDIEYVRGQIRYLVDQMIGE